MRRSSNPNCSQLAMRLPAVLVPLGLLLLPLREVCWCELSPATRRSRFDATFGLRLPLPRQTRLATRARKPEAPDYVQASMQFLLGSSSENPILSLFDELGQLATDGNHEAEILLLGMLTSSDKMVAQKAGSTLKKVWAHPTDSDASDPALQDFRDELLSLSSTLVGAEAVQSESPPAYLLPGVWTSSSSSTLKAVPPFIRWGAKFMHWFARPGCSASSREAQTSHLKDLASAWEPYQAHPDTSHRRLGTQVHRFIKTLMASMVATAGQGEEGVRWAEAKNKLRQARLRHEMMVRSTGVGGMVSSERSSARHFSAKGWAHFPRVGVAPEILAAVRRELAVVEPDMELGKTSSSMPDYRLDRAMFFDFEDELVRHDIPGLHELDDFLYQKITSFCNELHGTPLQVTLKGRVKPMVACYNPGGYYKRHVDNRQRLDGRVLTAVYYMNPGWHADMGGALRLYPDATEEDGLLGPEPKHFVEFMPEEDSLVLFLADRVVHEVRPSKGKRFAMTQWYYGKTNP